MIKLEHIEVFGWRAAIRGMRNPMNSWNLSDSYMGYDCKACGRIDREDFCEPKKHECSEYLGIQIGTNDYRLMKKLVAAGTDHRKFMRMIHVQMDITAPLYWWKEFDTYKVGTVANSCSTMHKIAEKEFTLEDFSNEHLIRDKFFTHYNGDFYIQNSPFEILRQTVAMLNTMRDLYIKSNDKKYWWQMIQLLPSSYNQKRTVDLNYETLSNMYHARKEHKLDEWKDFCKEIKNLPVADLITSAS